MKVAEQSSGQKPWKDRSVLVVGLSQSGTAGARLLLQLGAQVCVTEQQPRMACAGVEELEAKGARVVCGGHPFSLLEGVDVVVKNPGIPYRIPLLEEALRLGLPIVTEVEVASSVLSIPTVAITGSNGKTTTTAWIGHMMKQAGVQVAVAGNIGRPLAEIASEVLAGKGAPALIVLEMSSFQLKGTRTFRPDVALLLNLVGAHLDYHGTMADYSSSKQRIFANQTASDIAILPASCATLPDLADRVAARVVRFGADRGGAGTFVREGAIWLRLEGGAEQRLVEVEAIRLPGAFNIQNAQAAAAAAMMAGCAPEAVRESLATFTGVPHRLMWVDTIGGVRYYDDSKATNLTAVQNAIQAVEGPIILIAGGVDRGEDFAALMPLLQERVRCVLAYGQAQSILLRRAAKAHCRAEAVADVEEAVERAQAIAQAGDVILLSPGCASWDCYSSFEERGQAFQKAVHRISR